MHDTYRERWQHSHSFGQDGKRPGETRTLAVVLLTFATMLAEMFAGLAFGSMALLADGLHMASHTAALAINAMAYVYCRRHAHDARFSFGSGKVNALGGFTGAIMLVVFAVAMAWQSIDRFLNPVAIAFDQAILVAALGLLVNALSAVILDHGHSHDRRAHTAHEHSHHRHAHPQHRDHNLRSAYLHVLADALTSILAIAALLGAKYFGQVWLDPVMGILGALLVINWSRSLVRSTSAVLLDHQGPREIRQRIRHNLESGGDNRVVDLHLWSIAPELYGLIVVVVSSEPRSPMHYKRLLPAHLPLAHVTVEVHPQSEHATSSKTQSGMADKQQHERKETELGGTNRQAI